MTTKTTFCSPLAIWLAAATLALAGCATPATTSGTNGADAVLRHALVRATPAAPDWVALRQRLQGAVGGLPGVTLKTAEGGGLNLQVPVADGFAAGKSEIRPALARTLDALASALAAAGNVAIRIIGHTDSQGSEMVNLRLSIARAEAVAEYLRQRGIALERLSADGRGESDPLASNASEEGRARNRRVEILLRPMP